MVYRILFRYYKDYKYKAKLEYDKYEMQKIVCLSLEAGSSTCELAFDPFKLKHLFISFKFIR